MSLNSAGFFAFQMYSTLCSPVIANFGGLIPEFRNRWYIWGNIKCCSFQSKNALNLMTPDSKSLYFSDYFDIKFEILMVAWAWEMSICFLQIPGKACVGPRNDLASRKVCNLHIWRGFWNNFPVQLGQEINTNGEGQF